MRFRAQYSAVLLVALIAILSVGQVFAGDAGMSELKLAMFHAPLGVVGKGTYRKFGFRVYNATLYAPNNSWSADKPFALELHYTRDVSKDTLADTVIDNIKEQDVTDQVTFAKWEKTLREVLPAVADGDTMTGVSIPGKKSLLLKNGEQIASLEDPALSEAFFNIWLGSTADEDMRNSLLGRNK